jgi:DNA gyrase inhibitor GyrI
LKQKNNPPGQKPKPIPRFIFLATIPLTLLAMAATAIVLPRLSTPSPKYTVLKRIKNFEIRRYPEMLLATAPLGEKRNINAAFGKLFRYISGDNSASGKIAMTTPVLIEPRQKHMAFIFPDSHKNEPPKPREDVTLATLPPGRYAALRFTDSANSPASADRAAQKLGGWLQEHGIKTSGPHIIAYYDPPWTPGFLRRNEILMPLLLEEDVSVGNLSEKPDPGVTGVDHDADP